MGVGMFHPIRELKRPFQGPVLTKIPAGVPQVILQADLALRTRRNVIHCNKQSARIFYHKFRGQNKRVLIQINPHQSFLFEFFPGRGVTQKLITESFKS